LKFKGFFFLILAQFFLQWFDRQKESY
jgi:hypothetical protein